MCARPCLVSPPEGVDILNTYVCLSPCFHQLDACVLLELVDNTLLKSATEEQWPARTQERLTIISTRHMVHTCGAGTHQYVVPEDLRDAVLPNCSRVAAGSPG